MRQPNPRLPKYTAGTPAVYFLCIPATTEAADRDSKKGLHFRRILYTIENSGPDFRPGLPRKYNELFYRSRKEQIRIAAIGYAS